MKVKGPATALLLGQHLYLPATEDAPGVWRAFPVGKVDETVGFIAEYAAQAGIKRLRVIFETSGLSTDEIESPKVNRATLQQIPELQARHEALGNEHLGWGFQPHWTAGGERTLLHAESATGLLTLVDDLAAGGIRVDGAWPATSLGFGRGAPGRVYALLIVDAEEAFLYVEAKGQRTPIKFAGGSSRAGFWADMRQRLDAFGMTKNTELHVISNLGGSEKIAEAWPEWTELQSSIRVTESDFDTLPLLASKLRPRGNDNLTGAFPQPMDVTPLAQMVGVAAIVLALGFSIWQFMEQRTLSAECALQTQKLTAVQAEVTAGKARKKEYTRMVGLFGDEISLTPPSRRELLVALGDGLPKELSLTEFEVTSQGQVRIEGVVWFANGATTQAQVIDPVLARLAELGKGTDSTAEFTPDLNLCRYDGKSKWTIAGKLTRNMRGNAAQLTQGGSQ